MTHLFFFLLFGALSQSRSFLYPVKPILMGVPSESSLLAKKKKRSSNSASTNGGGYNKQAQKQSSSKQQQSKKFEDAVTSQFQFTMVGLSKRTPDGSKTLLDNVNLSFYPGAKIGVVGLNGAGKSTMLKIMAGLDKEFDGIADPKPGSSVGYLSQDPTLDFDTVGECIEPAIASSRKILDDYNELSAKMGDTELSPDEMQKVYDDFEKVSNVIEARDLWELDRNVERTMDALRTPPKDAKTATLSGGEKRRVNLCKLLLENHDMLLLDEPTNHLDAESITWLETFLDKFAGTIVCVTHDRYFLENVAQWILELDRGAGIPFEGNYSDWLEAKTLRLEGEKQSQTNAAKAVKAELEWVKSTPKAKTTKSKARLNRYEELLSAAAPKELRTTGQIFIPPGPRLGDVVVNVKGGRKQFGDKLLFDDVNFELPRSSICGIIGPNGAGKTTLVNAIVNRLQLDSGEVVVGDTVVMVGISQERMTNLEETKTVYEELSEGQDDLELGTTIVNSRAYCSWFGFKSAQQQQTIAKLSGGERNRVHLGKLLKANANFIVLDEPTNDLDVETMRSLEEGLLNFAGCALVVSHDRFFLDRICTHIIAFEGDSKVHFFAGNYAEYEEDRQRRMGDQKVKRIKYAPVVLT